MCQFYCYSQGCQLERWDDVSVEREPEPDEELYTVDELAAATGMTVRTTRYYAGLGLLPPPTRRGRMAYYTEEHRARLELIRALQDHGFTLSAIEKYLARVPADASVEDLALQRAMLTSWGAGKRESMTRRQLETRARRKLDDDEIQRLVKIYAIRWRATATSRCRSFDVALKLYELDIPVDSMEEAAQAINRHMDAAGRRAHPHPADPGARAVPGPGAQRSRQGRLRADDVATATADARGGRCRLPAGGQPGDHPLALGVLPRREELSPRRVTPWGSRPTRRRRRSGRRGR